MEAIQRVQFRRPQSGEIFGQFSEGEQGTYAVVITAIDAGGQYRGPLNRRRTI
jgi:hypothetical protein